MCIWLGEYPPYVPHKSGRRITQIATRKPILIIRFMIKSIP